jgi:hypothetical protein
MSYPEYQSDLDRTYESEVLGETLFEAAARLTRSRDRRDKWRRLEDLEKQTMKRLQDFLAAHGERATAPPLVRAKATVLGSLLAVLPWDAAMKLLGDGTVTFIDVFERLERNAATETSKSFFSYVLAHERAIAEFTHRERAGRPTDSIEPVTRLLARSEISSSPAT